MRRGSLLESCPGHTKILEQSLQQESGFKENCQYHIVWGGLISLDMALGVVQTVTISALLLWRQFSALVKQESDQSSVSSK